MKGWNVLKTWWSGGTSAATDESTSASGFIENLFAQPGEVIEDASSLFANAGAEDAIALLVLAKLRKRDGSNCTQCACGGAAATSFHTYDCRATLYRTRSGSIHSFNASGLLSDATYYAASLFMELTACSLETPEVEYSMDIRKRWQDMVSVAYACLITTKSPRPRRSCTF